VRTDCVRGLRPLVAHAPARGRRQRLCGGHSPPAGPRPVGRPYASLRFASGFGPSRPPLAGGVGLARRLVPCPSSAVPCRPSRAARSAGGGLRPRQLPRASLRGVASLLGSAFGRVGAASPRRAFGPLGPSRWPAARLVGRSRLAASAARRARPPSRRSRRPLRGLRVRSLPPFGLRSLRGRCRPLLGWPCGAVSGCSVAASPLRACGPGVLAAFGRPAISPPAAQPMAAGGGRCSAVRPTAGLAGGGLCARCCTGLALCLIDFCMDPIALFPFTDPPTPIPAPPGGANK
jgi:hypothetical protein